MGVRTLAVLAINHCMSPSTMFARNIFQIVALVMCAALPVAAASLEILTTPSSTPSCVTIVGPGAAGGCAIVVAANDYDVVQLTGDFFADDVQRVTGRRPR